MNVISSVLCIIGVSVFSAIINFGEINTIIVCVLYSFSVFFAAIEMIIGHRYELDDFQIQTVTEGRDSMGSALIKLRANGKVYSGNGLSTDIIGASIRAYISALNKIIYEEADSPRSV